jgi:hypothetical protein
MGSFASKIHIMENNLAHQKGYWWWQVQKGKREIHVIKPGWQWQAIIASKEGIDITFPLSSSNYKYKKKDGQIQNGSLCKFAK